jgi:hypothetical protein
MWIVAELLINIVRCRTQVQFKIFATVWHVVSLELELALHCCDASQEQAKRGSEGAKRHAQRPRQRET